MAQRLIRVTAAVVLAAGAVAAAAAPTHAAVRGFDGSTITVAGLGIKGQLPTAEVGARARIKRFDDTNEIKGVKIRFAEMADDKQDGATALSEARRLVAQDGAFAIVGDISANNPGDYFAQQHVPYFGGAFDNTYCSPKPSTSVWGFGIYGCLGTDGSSFVGDAAKVPYEYTTKQLHKPHPSIVIFSNDNQTGKLLASRAAVAYRGAGFDVAAVQNTIPVPSPSDYTPYVDKVLTGADGHAPDSVLCQTTLDCLGMWDLMKARGYQGVFITGLYAPALVKSLAGTVASQPYVNPADDTAGYRQMKHDLDAVSPGASAKVDTGTVIGYASTDMFIQALRKVAKRGRAAITPERVQQAASRMTWKIDGVSGPTQYPASTVYGHPTCRSLFASDGTTWKTVEPFTCSSKTYPATSEHG
jgi:ABC-type branched-subunit amino acid transport system substrate-binding protein